MQPIGDVPDPRQVFRVDFVWACIKSNEVSGDELAIVLEDGWILMVSFLW
jgi:hypothetical protein